MTTKKLIVSITGRTKRACQKKLKEVNKHKIKEIALFFEMLKPRERRGILTALKHSCVKKIPLVHLRKDTTKQEIAFLIKHFGSKYFTIHEPHFQILN